MWFNHDVYRERWKLSVAASDGPVPGSRLCAPEDVPKGICYEVAVKGSEDAWTQMAGKRSLIADRLGVKRERLFLEPGFNGRALLTIVDRGDVFESAPRFVVDAPHAGYFGTIEGVGRYVDGLHKLTMSIWDDSGTVPTALVGDPKSGRTSAANQLAVAALSSGMMHLMLVDPKGTGSKALRRAARVAFVGPEAARAAVVVTEALLQARAAYAMRDEFSSPWSTREHAGWTVLHDDFDEVADNDAIARRWTRNVLTCRPLGVWPVFVNRSFAPGAWHTQELMTAFASQVQAFRSEQKLPELSVRPRFVQPRDLPVGCRPGTVIPDGPECRIGGVPAQWNWLPDDDEKLDFEPPLRLGAALAKIGRQAELAEVDIETLTELLGEPVDSRWEIGPEGTHSLPADRLPPRRPEGPRPEDAKRSREEVRRVLDSLVRSGSIEEAEPGVWRLPTEAD